MSDHIRGEQVRVLSWVSWAKDPAFLLIISALFAVDQVTKALVRNSLLRGESVPDEGFFRFTHTTNTGSAFGLFPDQTLFLTIASFFGIGILFFVYRNYGRSSILLRLCLGMQMGGAFGNLVDRVRMGEVTDFIDVGPWPVFNVADASIVVGIIFLVILFVSSGTETNSARQERTAGENLLKMDLADCNSSAGFEEFSYRSALPSCRVCASEMDIVSSGWRCSGCGILERVEREE